MLFVLSLERPSLSAFDACVATFVEVTFLAIIPPFRFIETYLKASLYNLINYQIIGLLLFTGTKGPCALNEPPLLLSDWHNGTIYHE